MQAVIAVLVWGTAIALPVQDIKKVVPVVNRVPINKNAINMQAIASPEPQPPSTPKPAGWWGGDEEAPPAIDKAYYKDQLVNATMDQGKVPPPSFPPSYYKGIYFRPFGMKDTLDIKKGRKTLEKYKARATAEFTEQENRISEYEGIVKDRENKIIAIKNKFPGHPEVIGPLDHYLNGDLATYKMKLITHKKIAKIYLDNYLDYMDDYSSWAGLSDEDYARQAMYESRINHRGDELESKGIKAGKEVEQAANKAAGLPVATATPIAVEKAHALAENLVAQVAAESQLQAHEFNPPPLAHEAGSTFWKAAVAPEHPRLQAEVERTVTKPGYSAGKVHKHPDPEEKHPFKPTSDNDHPPTPPQPMQAMGVLGAPPAFPSLSSAARSAVNMFAAGKEGKMDERKLNAQPSKNTVMNPPTSGDAMFSTHDKVIPDSSLETSEAMPNVMPQVVSGI